MNVAIFGATGRTGRLLVGRALERGYGVAAFARDPGKLGISHERLTVIEGDATDGPAVERAVSGQDAVMSALGHAKGSGKDVQAVGSANIVAAMEKQGVRRLVSLTGAGVRAEGDEPKLVDKAFGLLLKALQREVLEDAARHVEVIRESGLDWVVVRAPRLTEGERKGRYRVGPIGRNSGTRISRADLADFMLDQLTDDAHLRGMPVVSY